MKQYWYDYIFEDERKFEDNKCTVYDSNKLNELSSWRTNDIGLNKTWA